MCGICGIISWRQEPSREAVRRMMDKMAHRGPDAEGMYANGPAVLGHRRLSIIDTSAAANQPMSSPDGRFHIVFNGEIYNFMDIRSQLGGVFSTNSDTEVLLAAYGRWGAASLERLNGMFAMAIWDSAEQTLFMARDRLGEKPLYYIPLPDGGVAFASELTALRESPHCSGRISMAAISHYLSLGYTLAAAPPIEGVAKMEPGTFIVFKNEEAPAVSRYWDLAGAFNGKLVSGAGEAAERLDGLLADSVRLRLVSDVPLGAFLSGGIDSSSIVSAMARLRPPEGNLTFSAGFNEKTFSELDEARAAAEYLKTAHHGVMVDADMGAELERIVRASDGPFADTSMIPMYFLAKFAREKVTVCLSGDGGDEVLAGYTTYTADKLRLMAGGLGPVLSPLAAMAARLVPAGFNKVGMDFKLRQFARGLGMDPRRAHMAWREIFIEEEKRKILGREAAERAAGHEPWGTMMEYFGEAQGMHPLDAAMYVDIKTWLPSDILHKVDRMTMAHSLESRAPFLDHRLVEFCASLPADMKMKGFKKKWILKQAMARHLPPWITGREKLGFNAPVSHWLNTSLARYQDAVLQARIPGGPRLFNEASVRALWMEHKEMKADHGFKLFALVCLALWIEG